MKKSIIFKNIISSFVLLLLLALVLGTGVANASIGRFAPTHDIIKQAGCASCHPEQVVELASTSHLSYFVNSIQNISENMAVPGDNPLTSEEAVTAACIVCHGTWINRKSMYINGYRLEDYPDGMEQYKMVFNSVSNSGSSIGTAYNVAVTAKGDDQTILLGADITINEITVQDPGSSDLVSGELLIAGTDYTDNATSVTLLCISEKVSELQSGGGTVKVVYMVNTGEVKNLKEVWGDLSARSPAIGVWQSENGGINGMSSVEGYYSAVIESFAYNLINEKKENSQSQDIYYQHDMAYTSTEYSAKQVKLCAVCHFNKLPPMTSDGEPLHNNFEVQHISGKSHSGDFNAEITVGSSGWAHKQVQCIKCHSHAGID